MPLAVPATTPTMTPVPFAPPAPRLTAIPGETVVPPLKVRVKKVPVFTLGAVLLVSFAGAAASTMFDPTVKGLVP